MAELFTQFDILGAFRMTILLTVLSAIGSLVIGTVVAVMRVSPVRILQFLGTSYVNVFRNTPLTLIVAFCNIGLFVNLGLRLADPNSPTFLVDNNIRLAVLGLSVYHAAFVCESLRSGINTVPTGQAEAARSIGLTFTQTLTHVVMPQAFRGAIAPLGNTLIALTKNTTVVSVIGVAEASDLMADMIEQRPDVALHDVRADGARLRHPHAPGRRRRHQPVPSAGGEAMSEQTVLFDAPGPRALRRYRIAAGVGGALSLAVFAGCSSSWARRATSRAPSGRRSCRPTPGPSTSSPGLIGTLKAAAISIVLAGALGLLLGIGRLSSSRRSAGCSRWSSSSSARCRCC